jgi:hypothetical protein
VFDAFLTIYKQNISDLLRIASSGTGILPEGELHPDLVGRLASEASLSATHVLNMCIRALDYCPPVDVSFGDYLRAIITADRDLVPNDGRCYRTAMVEAFRRRGIYPEGVRSLSSESLSWSGPLEGELRDFQNLLPGVEELRRLPPDWSTTSDRKKVWDDMRTSAEAVHAWLTSENGLSLGRKVGLAVGPDAPFSIERSGKNGLPKVEVHSVRPTRRRGPDGHTITDLVIEITQRRRGYFDPQVQEKVDRGELAPAPRQDFWLRGGSTFLIDLEKRQVRYSIGKGILREARLDAQRRFLETSAQTLRATYFGDLRLRPGAEPFALLHRSL